MNNKSIIRTLFVLLMVSVLFLLSNNVYASTTATTGTAIPYEYGSGYFTFKNGVSWTAKGGSYINTCDDNRLCLCIQ